MSDEELMADDEELMADDEELFSDDGEDILTDELEETDTVEEFEAPGKKKRSKLKWLFMIIILIVAAIAALLGLDRMGYVQLPINDYIPVDKLFDEYQNTIKVEAEIKEETPILPPPPTPPPAKADSSQKTDDQRKLTDGYFLKIGSCLYKACRKEITGKMAMMKLPVIEKQTIQSTTYYELISESGFPKKRAEEKLRLLNKYNETIGFPYLLRTRKGRYIISFGQFPQKSSAIQMKSQLEHLYSQIRMRFLIRTKKDRVTITKLFAGPYNKGTAEQIRMKLRDNPDFEWIEIVKLP